MKFNVPFSQECRVFSTILFDHFGDGFLIHATHGRLIGVGSSAGSPETTKIGSVSGLATASLRATGQLAATLISMARGVRRLGRAKAQDAMSDRSRRLPPPLTAEETDTYFIEASLRRRRGTH